MAAPIPPAIVCESSPGKHHAYWPVADMPLGDFKRAQQSLAALYGGDPAVCDLPRIMRLPGYTHAKGEPFASRLLHCDPVKPWRWPRSEEHKSELQSLMRNTYAVFCLKNKNKVEQSKYPQHNKYSRHK